jgi:hypothetical protein
MTLKSLFRSRNWQVASYLVKNSPVSAYLQSYEEKPDPQAKQWERDDSREKETTAPSIVVNVSRSSSISIGRFGVIKVR